MCGLTKHKVKMDRDSDATEIEDESLSLHIYFSGEDSASLLSGTPKVRFCFLFCFFFFVSMVQNQQSPICSNSDVSVITNFV